MRLEALLGIVMLAYGVDQSLAARILVVIPFPGKSHHIFVTAIMEALTQRGHQVLEFSPFSPKAPIPNHTHVKLHTRFEKELREWTYEDFITHPASHDHCFYGFKVKRIWEMNREVCEDTFDDENIQKLLKSDSKFDLVMVESTFGQESLVAFGHHFGASVVALETFIPWVIPNWETGNALSTSFVPDLFSPTFENDPMSFKDRVLNFVSTMVILFKYHHSHLPFHEQLVKQHFPGPGTPSVAAMVSDIALYLTNSHPSVVNYVQPYTPNIVPVGGLHIPSKPTPLPADIQSFLNDAKAGFIFFSLGTVVPLHVFPMEELKKFINVFKRLPQKVLWRIALEKLDGLPENVKITKWAPQIGVLEHPNCQLFITHGGLFSHHEAIYAGVPTVGIPFFADQPYNLQYRVSRGSGLRLDLATLTEDSFYTAVTTILNNSRYIESARRLSKVYRDRPVAPIESAMFWLEYVLRHGGASLRPASTRLSWHQLALLDVLGAILAAVAVFVAVLYTIVRCLLRLVCGRKGQPDTTSSKKKN